MSNKLLPCPFCGCHEPGTAETTDSKGNSIYFITCPDCHTDGPPTVTEPEAVVAWNKRLYREEIQKAMSAAETAATARKLFS